MYNMITDFKTKLATYQNNFVNNCDDASFNSIKCKKQIGNRISEIGGKEFANYKKNENKIDQTYKELSEEIVKYNKNNQKLANDPKSYERIDNNGNLFKEINRTIIDGRSEDNRELLINQNTSHIVYSLVISSIMILSIAFLY